MLGAAGLLAAWLAAQPPRGDPLCAVLGRTLRYDVQVLHWWNVGSARVRFEPLMPSPSDPGPAYRGVLVLEPEGLARWFTRLRSARYESRFVIRSADRTVGEREFLERVDRGSIRETEHRYDPSKERWTWRRTLEGREVARGVEPPDSGKTRDPLAACAGALVGEDGPLRPPGRFRVALYPKDWVGTLDVDVLPGPRGRPGVHLRARLSGRLFGLSARTLDLWLDSEDLPREIRFEGAGVLDVVEIRREPRLPPSACGADERRQPR